MNTIDLKTIVETNGLDTGALALDLFPSNKYPKMALKRVLDGEALLDAAQISKLASILSVEVSTLYTEGWKAETKDNLHILTNQEFRAELNTKTWECRVFVKDALYHSMLFLDSGITLSAYIEKVNQIVETYKNQTK